MFIGHLVGDADGPDNVTFNSQRDLLAFLCFLVHSITGLTLAYKRPLLGGTLAVLSVLGLFLLMYALARTGLWGWMVPGCCMLLLRTSSGAA